MERRSRCVSLKLAKERGIPVYVVGVGTSASGLIPEPAPKTPSALPEPPIHSTLDRESSRQNRRRGRWRIPRARSARVTARSPTRSGSTPRASAAGSRGLQVGTEELYWRLLLAAVAVLCVRAALRAGARRAVAASRRGRRRARAGVDPDTIEPTSCVGYGKCDRSAREPPWIGEHDRLGDLTIRNGPVAAQQRVLFLAANQLEASTLVESNGPRRRRPRADQ